MDKEQPGKEGPADGDDEGPFPGLRKDEFDEKGQEEKGREGKSKAGQKEIINSKG
jgi:hypothetical protein